MEKRSRRTPFQPEHEIQYALKVTGIDPDSNVVCSVTCKFCTVFGKDGRKRPHGSEDSDRRKKRKSTTTTVKSFSGPPFRAELFRRHHENQHREHWATYQALGRSEKLTYFNRVTRSKGMDKVVLIECGSGCFHGRDSTKAAIHACKNAIEFNSVKVNNIIPGGYEALKIHVHIGVPEPDSVDVEKLVDEVFPYGRVLPVVVEEGGLRASNTANMPRTGQPQEDMTLAVACISIGYDTVSGDDESD